MFKLIQLLLLWLSAMGWHLARIAIGKPAFKNMSDSGSMVFSFFAVFFGAGILRWGVLTDAKSLWSVGFGLFLHLVLVCAVLERSHRSSALSCAVLGVSAVVDLAASGLLLAGIDDAGAGRAAACIVEILLSIWTVFQFLKEPLDVQAHGYSYRNSAYSRLDRALPVSDA